MKKKVGGGDAARKGKMVYVKLWKLEGRRRWQGRKGATGVDFE